MIYLEDIFVTITGARHHFGNSLLKVGAILKLSKEPENPFDEHAISANLPALGIIGYVANSAGTLIEGTLSADELYQVLKDICYCRIMFKTDKGIIAKIL